MNSEELIEIPIEEKITLKSVKLSYLNSRVEQERSQNYEANHLKYS